METIPFANVDWTPLAKYPILPQVFPAESGINSTAIQIRDLWWSRGVKCVYMTYGTYGGAQPNWYNLAAPYSLYTADDCGNNYEPWKPTSPNWVACKEVPTMPEIGDQDGIRASTNRLRALDPGGTIVPQGQTIDDLTQPLSQWKAWDKLERTLQILKDDHDTGDS